MKKNILIIAVVFLMACAPIAAHAVVPLPFGGLVTAIQPCNTGLLVWVLTPLTGLVPFMWLTGELPFLMYTPPHPGQELLGLSATAVVPCVLGPVTIGAGLPIIMHGSSI